MTSRRNFSVGLTIVAWGLSVSAGLPLVQGKNSDSHSIKTQLQFHHIGLDRESLVEALRNPSSDVRYLAAIQLAGDGAKETVPAMESALVGESVPEAKLNIAYALALLGGANGLATLKGMCDDNSIDSHLKPTVVRYLLSLHETEKSVNTIKVLLNGSDVGSRLEIFKSIRPTSARFAEEF